MRELITNLHVHTIYSDGTGSHQQIARAALQTGIDVVIITDHNVLVKGCEGYHSANDRQVLVLVGEEIHDRSHTKQANHLLVLGANRELAAYAANPQRLIEQVQRAEGLSFIAHPYDRPMAAVGEDGIVWDDWTVNGFSGIEIWNAFSELKEHAQSKLQGIFYAYFPHLIAHGPNMWAMKKWDELLKGGKRVTAVGGSDAHALHMRMGMLKRILFPYEFHFRGVNTHLLVEKDLSGDLIDDRRSVINALRRGHAFIGYDFPASTRDFRFYAQGRDRQAIMGDDIELYESVTFQIRLPAATECRLIRDGEIVKAWHDRPICAYIARQPGAYRVEAYIEYMGKRRGWIFSNPIYVHSKRKQ
jgi:hypothetical protein